jgi:HTH-type transcriptional regulator/antitoxin HipB
MMRPRRRSFPDASTPAGALAEQFISRRIALGLTQHELADLSGVSRATVQALESADSGVRLGLAAAVARALGCQLRLEQAGGAA